MGTLAARTLIMTDEMVYVCNEDYIGGKDRKRFIILDSAPIKDVSAVSFFSVIFNLNKYSTHTHTLCFSKRKKKKNFF